MIQSKVHVKVAALHCTRSGACVELTKMRNLKHYVERRNQHAYAVMVAFEAEVERPSTNGLHEDVWDKAFYHLASYLLATCNTSHSVSMLLFALIHLRSVALLEPITIGLPVQSRGTGSIYPIPCRFAISRLNCPFAELNCESNLSVMCTTNSNQDCLSGFFGAVLSKKVQSVDDSKLLINAILNQGDHFVLIERLLANEQALGALRIGLRLDTTADFLNQYTAKFVHYLNDQNIKAAHNGECLQQILLIVVEPPTVWNAFKAAFYAHKLDHDAIRALFWMAAELLSFPSSRGLDVRADVQALNERGIFILRSIT